MTVNENEAMLVAMEIRSKLEASLADFSANTVVLSRDEGILTLGMINALIEEMDKANPNY